MPHPTPAADQVYRPILRTRRGELLALHHFDPAIVPLVAPVLVPSPTQPDVHHLLAEIRDARLPPGLRIAVDTAGLPDTSPTPPSYALAKALAERDVPMLPVIRLSDDEKALAAHGAAARLHLGRAVIRLRPPRDPPQPSAGIAACVRAWRGSGLNAEQCDLLIDLAEVRCAADVTAAERRVRNIGSWVWRYPWASVTLVCGAMPPSVAHLPLNAAAPLWRWDAALWRRFASLGVGYGDYGIACPSGDADDGRAVPTLRYTTRDAWWIYRWNRHGGRGDEHLYELCQRLVGSEHWPRAGAAVSWGDREISRRARHKPGPGTTTSWLAWGTSHHLAHVVASLTGESRLGGQIEAQAN